MTMGKKNLFFFRLYNNFGIRCRKIAISRNIFKGNFGEHTAKLLCIVNMIAGVKNHIHANNISKNLYAGGYLPVSIRKNKYAQSPISLQYFTHYNITCVSLPPILSKCKTNVSFLSVFYHIATAVFVIICSLSVIQYRHTKINTT